jgi:hypothetical protein
MIKTFSEDAENYFPYLWKKEREKLKKIKLMNNDSNRCNARSAKYKYSPA